jgi:hypothetical protein
MTFVHGELAFQKVRELHHADNQLFRQLPLIEVRNLQSNLT